jgi:phospholipase C
MLRSYKVALLSNAPSMKGSDMQDFGFLRRSIASIVAGVITGAILTPAYADNNQSADAQRTATPIKHLVVIFQENVSFDHYFGTYPWAANPAGSGEPVFSPRPGTPAVNGLSGTLLNANPNATNKANGLMDAFPASVGTAGPPPAGSPITATTGLTMGYYDGNTVTALWNYAQHFAMSDNSYDTNFGPSTPGAINLVSGQTNGVTTDLNPGGNTISDGNGGLTLISDADPVGDVCSTTSGEVVQFGGKNIGDLLSAANVSWGFFSGGFNLGVVNSNTTTGCKRSTTSTVTNTKKADYIPHHQPFQYYASTANPTHARPSSLSKIGKNGDGANHQYDVQDFFDAVSAGNFPSVSYLKAPGFQDGHAGYSDPLDEQTFLVQVINFLQKQRDWESTAVVIAYDDSDGWYDHALGQIVNQSTTSADALSGLGACGDGSTALPGINPATKHAQGRCGFGPRLPLLVISPWAKRNFVDHTITDQSSVLRFVEDNWLKGARLGAGSFDTITNPINNMFNFEFPENLEPVILDPNTGLETGRRGW